MRKRNFSLLEVMVAIAILAIAAGALFYRIPQLIEKNRFDSDSGRLKNLLLSSRMLALNTHSDWRLDFKKEGTSWKIQLLCLEDKDLIYPAPKLSQNILFNDREMETFFIDFFSTGLVRPSGVLALKGERSLSSKLALPELFQIEENGKIPPFHPAHFN